jgi:hypothetical protein
MRHLIAPSSMLEVARPQSAIVAEGDAHSSSKREPQPPRYTILHPLCYVETDVGIRVISYARPTQERSRGMRKRRPLTDEDGEVRELLLEDMKRFRPIAEVLSPASLEKLGLKSQAEQRPPGLAEMERTQASPNERLRAKSRQQTSANYTTKQLGDAGEMIIAAELTLHFTPTLKAPDFWPGCDVIAQPKGRAPQRISVKTRTYGRIDQSVGYDDIDEFDWLAVVVLLGPGCDRRRFFIVRRSVADERGSVENRRWKKDPRRHPGRNFFVHRLVKRPTRDNPSGLDV